MNYGIIILLLCGFAGKSIAVTDSSKHPRMTVEQVLNKYSDRWMSIPGVVGVAEGKSKGKPCIIILTSAALIRKEKNNIPKSIEGYKIIIERTGEIKAR